ncbi:P-loop containing nucleoside triphosphate hydrolase protein [Cantharellus anzutake]|uniref:P-loop containing nucleoside triphosphate hydrolase protein n=1 Tax=Cantharellus anzutake TaxID=1750568 RepID=UPI001905F751|nr:P-loop containing nucleoside triphosphate hydrolase protein [Cantharellus anzutake]KAF8332585.1 P-loop containing nucleoside triphosphate hydrolase protein [Cantharellus anzutake]
MADCADLLQAKNSSPPPLAYQSAPWYLRVPFTMANPPLPTGTMDDAKLIPHANASWLSVLTFDWMTPILNLGYARPLETVDLWRLPDSYSAEVYADRILESFQRRHEAAEEYNARLASGEIKPGWGRKIWWKLRGNAEKREKHGEKRYFWLAGLLKVIADTAQITSPLVVKAIIRFATESYVSHKVNPSAHTPSVGRGIGLSFTLFIMQVISSLGLNHSFHRSLATGLLLRAGLITAIYRRSLRFTTRARSNLPSGKIVNHISTDVSRIDFCYVGDEEAVSPSEASMRWTDKRAKLLQELLSTMRVIKFFAWEIPFLERINEYRTNELRYIRNLLVFRASTYAMAFSLPVLSAVFSFVAYSLSGHKLQPDIVFTSLSLFQLLRIPLMVLPMSLGGIADASNAISRLHDVFTAELLTETNRIDPDLLVAVRVSGASFTWDGAPPSDDDKVGKKKKAGPPGDNRPGHGKEPEAKDGEEEGKASEEAVFKLQKVDFEVPRGQLCAIVGPVGSGKSSLLQGLLGEMRCTEGVVTFGGTTSYAPQTAWIQSASIRDNILFGREFDEERYWKVVHDAGLMADLDMLPQGDLTEVGEKGISLSGGQKQRVNIARTLYCSSDIVCLDDPFSALDAHVGKHVFENAVLGSLAKKTRLLVTHALHFLPRCDYIITMLDGRIAERGTYEELMAKNGAFAKFVAEFGGKEGESKEDSGEITVVEGDEDETAALAEKKRKEMSAGPSLMQPEERAVGAVDGRVYAGYLRAAHGFIFVPLLLLVLLFVQGSQVMSTYWLVYWQERKWPYPQGFYMGVYAGLGFMQAATLFSLGVVFALMTFYSSVRLHRGAIERIMQAPMSFFDTTPLGRIMNRFSKDIDTLDNQLSEALRFCFITLTQIIGAVILLAILLPWFLLPVFFITAVYWFTGLFYRSSARELKRLEAILRSTLYSHFSESLFGLATIRAFGESERFLSENTDRMDKENRAYWLTITNQRWLSIRLDFLGALLTLSVALLTVGSRSSISPSQTGVSLSYILLVQQSFSWLVRQTAEVENNMNSVERVLHYANELEQEAPHFIEATKPLPEWPSRGEIKFKDVVMSYRPGLPPVLKGLSLNVKEGEHVGIVGRTGAGKSTIMATLYRLVELTSGTITIDDVDISTLGLSELRSKIAIIPQDPTLFSGTLRSNLDPFGLYEDARLWDALKRAQLVATNEIKSDKEKPSVEDDDAEPGVSTSQEKGVMQRFTLDTPIDDGGTNISVGQRSLVSLARALVKDSKIVLLDEATASVDYETDTKIQDTIASEFSDRTLLCIAHRIKTIIGYDRICVMDAGQIAELDTPLNLFNQPNSIFRSMCDRSGIIIDDVRIARKEWAMLRRLDCFMTEE